LIACGALETFGTIPVLLTLIKQDRWQQAQLSLFPNETQFDEDWDLGRKAAAQERILGIGVVAHPLELYAQKLSGKPVVSSLEAAGKIGRSVMIAGMRQTWHRSSTGRGEKIYLMESEDMEGTIVVLINSNVYTRFRSELNRGRGPFLIEGVVELEERSIEPMIRASRIENIARWES
jgi:DNA polymerase III alpha subunit